MIAHEATDISIRIASSVLPTASLWLDEVAEAEGGGDLRVHCHFSRSKSSGTNAQPATGLAVLGVGLEARLAHRGDARPRRAAREAGGLRATCTVRGRPASSIKTRSITRPVSPARRDRRGYVGHRRVAEVLHRRRRDDLGRRRAARAAAARPRAAAAAAPAAAGRRAAAPADEGRGRGRRCRGDHHRRRALRLRRGTRRRRRRRRHRLRRLGRRDQADEHRRHVGDPFAHLTNLQQAPDAGSVRGQDRADHQMALRRRQDIVAFAAPRQRRRHERGVRRRRAPGRGRSERSVIQGERDAGHGSGSRSATVASNANDSCYCSMRRHLPTSGRRSSGLRAPRRAPRPRRRYPSPP